MVPTTRIFDLASAVFQTFHITGPSTRQAQIVNSGLFAQVLESWADHDIITPEEARATARFMALAHFQSSLVGQDL